MNGFTIERLAIPSTLDGPEGADFRAAVDVRNASESRAYGTPEVAYPAEELFPNWQDAHEPKVLWVARVDGRIVGRAIHESQLQTAADVGWIDVDVHPEFERRGIGRALNDTVEAYARELGQSRLITYAISPPRGGSSAARDSTSTAAAPGTITPGATAPGTATPGTATPGTETPGTATPADEPAPADTADDPDGLPERRLIPPTGYGSVPTDNREVQFLLNRGYRLEQIERASRLALPVDPAILARVRQDAHTAADAEYGVRLWRGSTPERWSADLALLFTRMSTDAPTAGLDEPEDVWSVDRLVDYELRQNSGPRVFFTAAIEHLPSGKLVAFNQLAVPADLTRPVGQQDTLVLREHRGNRLGTLVKLANLDQLQSEAPGHPSILTWNAEENRFMLRVNEALGFVPIGYEGAWRLDL